MSDKRNVCEMSAWKDEFWALVETDCEWWTGSEWWSGSKFQTTGAAMKKLHLPIQLFWFVERTDFHARPSGDKGGLNYCRLCRQYCWNRQARCLGRSQKSVYCSNFEHCILQGTGQWPAMEDVMKNRSDALIFTKTNNETSGGVEYHL